MRAILLFFLLLTFPMMAHADGEFSRKPHQDVWNYPEHFQIRGEYTGANPVYLGYAPKGVADSASNWVIYKFTYDGDNMTLRQVAFGAWTGRAALTYE